jgi:hypothetical protein
MTNSREGEPGRAERASRAAEARQRADHARERAEEARDRLAELRQDQIRMLGLDGKPTGSTAERAARAGALADESRRQARRAAENAAAAGRASADVHDSAARLHDHLAELGAGDVDEHRRHAQQHRQFAAADRAEAEHDDELRDRFVDDTTDESDGDEGT